MIPISDFDDPRLDPHRNLRDKQLADQNRCITEGRRNKARLLGSGLEVESVLTDERRLAEIAPDVGGRAPLFVISKELMGRIAGFEIHTGVLSIGHRPAPLTIDEMMGRGS